MAAPTEESPAWASGQPLVQTGETSSPGVQEYGVPSLRAMAHRGWVVGGVLVAATLVTPGRAVAGTTSNGCDETTFRTTGAAGHAGTAGTGAAGGALRIAAGAVTLDHVTISQSSATGGNGGNGGATRG